MQQLNSNQSIPTQNSSPEVPSEPQRNESWVTEYYEAVKAGFMRVWHNRHLWFWGIFLPAGLGVNANYNFNSQDFFRGENVNGYARDFFMNVKNFVSEYLFWIILGVLLLLLIIILFWIVSAVARSGVIQALEALQNTKKGAIYTFKTIWQKGRQRFVSILMIDVIVGFSMMLIMIILAAPVVFLITQGRFGGAVLLGLLAFLIYIPLVLLTLFLKQIGVVVTVLSETTAIKAIETAYFYVRGNIKEALKLLLTMVVLGIVQGVTIFVAVFPVIVVVIGVALLFVGFSDGDDLASPEGRIIPIVIIVLVVLFALTIFLFIKSIFALWVQDLWLWWTKKVGSVMSVDESEKKVESEEAVKRKALTEAEEG